MAAGELKREILVIGAASLIAQETARNFANDGCSFFLVARNNDALAEVKNDLLAFGAGRVETLCSDLSDCSLHRSILDQAFSSLPGIDTVLLAYGDLGNQEQCEKDVEAALRAIQINFTSAVSFLTLIANRFELLGSGLITVITSVAGDFGRKKNYVYGSAKGGLNFFLQGLRARLFSKNVRVLTVKPGWVDTPMTAHLNKNFLFADAKPVGVAIYRAMRGNTDILYVPWFWRYILLIIKAIPEKIFKRMSI